MLLQQDQPDWPQHLSLICQAYRGLPVASTGYSPYERFIWVSNAVTHRSNEKQTSERENNISL